MLHFLCKLFCGTGSSSTTGEGNSAARPEDALRAVLKEDAVAIISASCCAPMAGQKDEALKNNIVEALKDSGRSGGYSFISITDAQRSLPRINDELEPAAQRVVSQIQMLVSSQGFSIFPILVIDRKVSFYGGIPTPDMIKEKLLHTAPASVS